MDLMDGSETVLTFIITIIIIFQSLSVWVGVLGWVFPLRGSIENS